ncbi:TPA: cytosine deaminase, partial [Klebsiella pneumoniae]
MTFPSSCAPLTGISRARLPAWALPDGWPTQANGEPLLADLAFRDGRIAALTPTDQPTPGLWDLAGALTLPGLVEPHAHLDKTFTIERCRPAQAGLLPAIHAMHEDRRHWSRADIQRRASTALARAAANGVTHLRSHVDWFTADAPDAWQEIARLDTVGLTLERVALVPLPLFRELAQAEAIARTVANSGERCLLGGFIHSSNWDATAMENLLYSAARWDLDLDLHIDEELSEVSQGLTWLADHLSRHPFPGHICCSHGCALAAGSDEQAVPILRQLAAHGVTLIALPMTNLLLQDATFGRTPRQRGIT